MEEKGSIDFGKVFVIEGGECSGKSTIARYLSENISDLVYLREPGGNPTCEKIRDVIVNDDMSKWCEALLFMASRANLIENEILPLITSGKSVVLDRFHLSNIVYQGIVKGCGKQEIIQLNNEIFKKFPEFKIAHTWILDIDIDTYKRRMNNNGRDNNKFEGYGLEFHKEILQAYRSLATYNNISLIDNNQDDTSASRDSIYNDISITLSLNTLPYNPLAQELLTKLCSSIGIPSELITSNTPIPPNK